MGRPRKPTDLIEKEGVSHRTKGEMEDRRKAEEAFATGVAIKARVEVRNKPMALKEFKRLAKLFKGLGKNDAMFEAVVNRYCMLTAEMGEMQRLREVYSQKIDQLVEDNSKQMEAKDYYKLLNNGNKNLIALDRLIMSKSKMMFDIEKENSMTIKAAMASIPLGSGESDKNPLEILLGDD